MRSLRLMGEEVIPAAREMGVELGLDDSFEVDPKTNERIGEQPVAPAGGRRRLKPRLTTLTVPRSLPPRTASVWRKQVGLDLIAGRQPGGRAATRSMTASTVLTPSMLRSRSTTSWLQATPSGRVPEIRTSPQTNRSSPRTGLRTMAASTANRGTAGGQPAGASGQPGPSRRQFVLDLLDAAGQLHRQLALGEHHPFVALRGLAGHCSDEVLPRREEPPLSPRIRRASQKYDSTVRLLE